MYIIIKEDDRIVVATTISYDFIGVSDADLIIEENSCMKIVDDRIYVFATGNRESDIFMYDNDFFNMEVNEKNMVSEIIPYMVRKVKNEREIEGLWKEPEWDNSLSIIKDSRIYDISPSFYFKEVHDYVCRAPYQNVLIGALDYTEGKSAEERIRKAIDTYTQVRKINLYPIKIYDTKSKTTTVWEK